MKSKNTSKKASGARASKKDLPVRKGAGVKSGFFGSLRAVIDAKTGGGSGDLNTTSQNLQSQDKLGNTQIQSL